MIFITILLLLALCTFREQKISYSLYEVDMTISKRKVYTGTAILCFIMFAICALRSTSVGIDTEHYYNSFQQGTNRNIEIGYWLVRDIALLFSNPFQVFLAIYAAASIFPLYYTLKRESVNVAFSLLIYLSFSNYFYPETFNTIRATASIAFYLLGLSFWLRHDRKIAIVLFLVSTVFHNSAIIALLLTVGILYINLFSRKLTYSALLLSVIFGLGFKSGFSDYAETISLWISSVPGDAIDYYSQYVNQFEETSFNIVGTLANMLPFTLFAIFLYDEENSRNAFYKLFVMGVILSNIFISVMLVYRITMFFTVMLLIVLPNTYVRLKGTKLKIVKGLIFFMILWYIYKLFGSTSDKMAGIIPYTFFFE